MAHVDVISDVLAAAVRAFPQSEFVQGLSHQYMVKGGLSKRQLEGLHKKAGNIRDLSPAKLATLEAIILKRPKKYRSELPVIAPLQLKDDASQALVADILKLHHAHKRVLYFASKLQKNDALSPQEIKELERFHKLLIK